jgi:hypothetical protein
VSGATVTSGRSITVTVTVASGIYPHGVGLFTKDPLEGADLQQVVGSTLHFTISIPTYTTPGPYPLFAVSVNAAGVEVNSAPITVNVERADMPTALSVDPFSLTLRFIGDSLPFTVWGKFAAGLQTDVTQSSYLIVTSENPRVAAVQNDIISAAGSGQTNIDVTYRSITVKVPVTVPSAIRGDLNGDGIVDQSDLNIILAALNTAANGPNDARDLNHDGKINELDAHILRSLCTHPGCASQ